jgi:Flp pilus assembly protein TadB
MSQYENLSQEQAHAVLDMMTSEQKRVMFETDRKKRIKQLQTLPKSWTTFLVIAALIVIGIGLFLELSIIAIIFPIVFLYLFTDYVWRYRSRHLVNSVRNERFEA